MFGFRNVQLTESVVVFVDVPNQVSSRNTVSVVFYCTFIAACKSHWFLLEASLFVGRETERGGCLGLFVLFSLSSSPTVEMEMVLFVCVVWRYSCPQVTVMELLLVCRLGALQDHGVVQTESTFWINVLIWCSDLMFWSDDLAAFVQDDHPGVCGWWSSIWVAMYLMSVSEWGLGFPETYSIS